ncbi:unnamed protein product [Lactuca virosa]|uniref:Gamma-glutamylcysteine synthetase n=1 Tax=Lactuca virosa TaxID=75947 RepID=A0AAU9MJJ0_9ASTR|nr:unnamed protein product [Lactuca virosa]
MTAFSWLLAILSISSTNTSFLSILLTFSCTCHFSSSSIFQSFSKRPFLVNMVTSTGFIPTLHYVNALWEKYGFQLEDEAVNHLDGPSFLEPPSGKVGAFVKTFDAGYRLPTNNF